MRTLSAVSFGLPLPWWQTCCNIVAELPTPTSSVPFKAGVEVYMLYVLGSWKRVFCNLFVSSCTLQDLLNFPKGHTDEIDRITTMSRVV